MPRIFQSIDIAILTAASLSEKVRYYVQTVGAREYAVTTTLIAHADTIGSANGFEWVWGHED